MNKLTVLLVCAVSLTLMSFSCSKQEDSIAQRQNEVVFTNATIDMRLFPEHTIFSITAHDGSTYMRFDSDSLKLYNVYVPEGMYRFRWLLVGTTKDKTSKAWFRNTNSAVSVPYEDGSIDGENWRIHGSYVFTKEKKSP